MKSFFRSPTKREQYALLAMDCGAIALALLLSIVFQLASQNKLSIFSSALGNLSLPSQLFAAFNLLLLFALASFLVSSAYAMTAYVIGVYEIDAELSISKKIPAIFTALLLSVGVKYFVIGWIYDIKLTTLFVFYFSLIAICLMIFQRLLYYHFSKNNSSYRILVLNRDNLADKAVHELMNGQSNRHFFVTYRDADDTLVLDGDDCDLVVYPFTNKLPNDALVSILKSKFKGISTCNSLTFYILSTGRFPAFDIDPRWFLDLSVSLNLARSLQRRIKRAVDIGLSLIGLVVSLPLMAIIALLVKKTSPGPVFFTHERLGLHEKPFLIYKFRTMVQNAEQQSGPVWAQKTDPRVTPLGKILRKTRLDELPQLFNVLKGDMSFVGPRPIRKFFADKLSQQFPFYFMRFYIKPGLTGWAQVCGGYGEDVTGQLVKLEYELFYLQEYTLFLDAAIILMTIKKVVWAQGQ